MNSPDPTNAANDSAIDQRREEVRQALNVVPDPRTDAANDHISAIRVVEELTGPLVGTPHSMHYQAFLAGWDAAMERTHAELFEENCQLRSKLDDMILEKFKLDE